MPTPLLARPDIGSAIPDGDGHDGRSAMSWNDGYVVDVPYVEQVFREMTPPWLSLTSVLNLQPPLDTTRPFTYLELGCGRGLTATIVAATNPSATVWACDFNPAHVERARNWQPPLT